MKILDKKGKLFGAINLVDLLFIILVLGIVAGGIYYFNKGGLKSGKSVDVVFTVELQRMGKEFTENINKGDKIKDSIKGYYLGVVSDVYAQPATVINFDTVTNTYVKSEAHEEYDVYITVTGNGTEDDINILSEGQPIKMGKEMTIKGKGYAGKGYVVKLETVEKGAEQ